MPGGVPVHFVWSIHGNTWIEKTGTSCYHEIMVTAEKTSKQNRKSAKARKELEARRRVTGVSSGEPKLKIRQAYKCRQFFVNKRNKPAAKNNHLTFSHCQCQAAGG